MTGALFNFSRLLDLRRKRAVLIYEHGHPSQGAFKKVRCWGYVTSNGEEDAYIG